MKKKSDDYELFLGKSGKNYIIGSPEKIKTYQDWVNLAFKFSLEHLAPIYEQENFENIIDISILEMSKQNTDKIEKNLLFLGKSGRIFQLVHKLNNHLESGAI